MTSADPADMDKWYREEHLPMLSKVSGYRRTLRYEIGPKMGLNKSDLETSLTLHAFDSIEKARESKEYESCWETEWAKKQLSECKDFLVRHYGSLHAEGQWK